MYLPDVLGLPALPTPLLNDLMGVGVTLAGCFPLDFDTVGCDWAAKGLECERISVPKTD